MTIFWGLIIPFIGTTAGAACVLFMKNELKPVIQKALLGFAAGVMVAASVWSLLIPAMDMSEHMGKFAFAPAAIGFIIGIAFLLLLDRIIPHLHIGSDESEGPRSTLKKSTMLVLAVTIHNIPEGISVGAVFAGLLTNNANVTVAGASLCLSALPSRTCRKASSCLFRSAARAMAGARPSCMAPCQASWSRLPEGLPYCWQHTSRLFCHIFWRLPPEP